MLSAYISYFSIAVLKPMTKATYTRMKNIFNLAYCFKRIWNFPLCFGYLYSTTYFICLVRTLS